MTEIHKSALVLHTADQMFDLINSVRHYPDFVPWCSKADVLYESDEEIEATLHVAKAGLYYQFTTRNRKKRPTYMDMMLVEGPFSNFSAAWHITPLSDDACKVEFTMKYDFAGRLANIAVNKLFSGVASTMVDVFVERANSIYG